MVSRTTMHRTLAWSTLALGGLTGLVLLAGVQGPASTDLSARLVTTSLRTNEQEVPTVHFTAAHALEGFSAPADTHVIFDVPEGTNTSRNVFFGPESDLTRYWGYCFDGLENARKRAGKTGMDIYNPQRFFYSLAERRAQGSRPKPGNEDLLGILESLHGAAPTEPDSYYNVFYGGESCYAQFSTITSGGVDRDNDLLNASLERAYRTDPNNPDTDGDGITDGDEAFITKTDPTRVDTDLDGLSDSCEDKNMNGQLDDGEITSPLTADSDKDGLCDGNACPDAFTTQRVWINGQWEWTRIASNPVWSELGRDAQTVTGCPSLDQYVTDPRTPTTFGEGDWDYQWGLYIGTSGRVADPLPIPELP